MIASSNSRMTPHQAETADATIFTRVLVGVDGSPEGIEAARQAASLLEPAGSLKLASAYNVATAAVGGGGMAAPIYNDEASLAEQADEALEAAGTAIAETPPAVTGGYGAVARGRAPAGDEARARGRRRGRYARQGQVEGHPARLDRHRADPQGIVPVLIARAGVASPPATVVVGVDGSPESRQALQAARRLCTRFGARLWPVVAHGGPGVDERRRQGGARRRVVRGATGRAGEGTRRRGRRRRPGRRREPRPARAPRAWLGFRAVAHEAPCSVPGRPLTARPLVRPAVRRRSSRVRPLRVSCNRIAADSDAPIPHPAEALRQEVSDEGWNALVGLGLVGGRVGVWLVCVAMVGYVAVRGRAARALWARAPRRPAH